MADRLRIPIVDGDEVDRVSVRCALSESEVDAELVEVASGAEAIEHLSGGGGAGGGGAGADEQAFDCVLMENHLPDGPGIELLRKIRSQQGAGAPPVPVIMMTAQ